jgi:hypothetical protein
VLLALSLILMATTVFPSLNVDSVALVLGALIVLGSLAVGTAALAPGRRARRRALAAERGAEAEGRGSWRMPQLALLERPVWSRGRTLTMWALRSYLVVAVILLFVKAVQLGTGH